MHHSNPGWLSSGWRGLLYTIGPRHAATVRQSSSCAV